MDEALTIGREWLGEHHPAVQCLQMGVAVHHGQLPRPFLRAVERLLKDQLLKVTISSPTLAQGLNLSATTVLFCSLMRSGDVIKGEEFANVAGRAGRAFVDVEGQVLCAITEPKHRRDWVKVLRAAKERNLKSGLLQLVLDFCARIAKQKEFPLEKVLEYVNGNTDIWTPPKANTPDPDDAEKAQSEFDRIWRADVACLDSALLSLVQHDVPVEQLASAIDEALTGSLWERSLRREDETMQEISQVLLTRRAAAIWGNSTATQRKGYFFAGVGLVTGQYLDLNAAALNGALLKADASFANADIDAAHAALVAFAEIAFRVEPFAPPDELPLDWKEIMRAWISAKSVADLAGNQDEELLEFIENALVYRLVWAMEAVRVRFTAEDEDAEWPNAGRAAVALETGTPDYCAALLIQNGLASRVAAIKAIEDFPAEFTDIQGMREWVRSQGVADASQDPTWPTVETAVLWRSFNEGFVVAGSGKWEIHKGDVDVVWADAPAETGSEVRLVYDPDKHHMRVFAAEMEPLGHLPYYWKTEPTGVCFGVVNDGSSAIEVTYIGPSDFFSNK